MEANCSQPEQILAVPFGQQMGELTAALEEISPERQRIVLSILRDLLARQQHDQVIMLRLLQAGPRADLWCLALVSPDGTANLLVAGPSTQTSIASGSKLLTALHKELERRGVEFVQAMRDPETTEPLLAAGGYQPLVVLDYLVADSAWIQEPQRRSGDEALCFTPYTRFFGRGKLPAKRSGRTGVGGYANRRLEQLVARTYVGSLDCPRLGEYRSCRQSLDAYRSNLHHQPELWFVASDPQGREVGCLLLTEQPATRILEITYMALTPEFRRRGWGNEIMRYAWQQAQRLNCQQITVAVDQENGAAKRLYQKWMLEPLMSERVWGRRV